ncbi:alpha/beta hydrolase [Aquipuribacter sp. SD81]|uniref:alpha/beta hydrolase n=1 Tax=Aquipuribacter sp. SD81 TaxID=3127703 RepID=UPI003FA56D96
MSQPPELDVVVAPAHGPVEIGPTTRLPARREDVELHTPDGLRLVGELALPEEREPRATLVTLHPLPTHGGYMDSHVLLKASWRLPALADLAVLRFNLRGVTSRRGTSEGAFDAARGEANDVAAALAFAEDHGLPHVNVLGWSFGTDLALLHARAPLVERLVLLSPPLRFTTDADLAFWAEDGRDVLALVPEHDDYLRPDQARERFAAVPQARVVGVDGAKHLWVGEQHVRTVLDHVVEAVRPGAGPLPTSWEGPYDRMTTRVVGPRTAGTPSATEESP